MANLTASARGADLTIMHALHDAFRRDLDIVARHASRRVNDPAARSATWRGWEMFKAQMHHHHTVEDTKLWPLMQSRLADRRDELAILDAMEDEHLLIDPAIAAVDSAFASGNAVAVSDAIDELRRVIRDHLAHEETAAMPIIDQVITPQEWDAFGKQQARDLGLKGAAELFPWLIEGSTPQRTTDVLGLLPPPLRVVAKRVWAPRFARVDRWA